MKAIMGLLAGAGLAISATSGGALAGDLSDYGSDQSQYYENVDGGLDEQQSYREHVDQNGAYCQHRKRQRSYDPVYDRTAGNGSYGGSLKDRRKLGSRCLGRWQIEESLVQQGWRDFRGLELAPDVVGVTASRPNGLTYRLKIDKCSGVILAANLLDQQDYDTGATASVYQPQY